MAPQAFAKLMTVTLPHAAERKGQLATTGHSTNFLMMIHMPSSKPEWQWILAGVCMLCSLTAD